MDQRPSIKPIINVKNITEQDFQNNKLIKEKVNYIYKLMSDLEFQVFGLPLPTCEIYLQVPFYHIQKVNTYRINNDNRIENLRFVCPNCNSQLSTHCRKKHTSVAQLD